MPKTPDIIALMTEIRARVKKEINGKGDNHPAAPTYSAHLDGGATRNAGELFHSEDLRYLNQHYLYGHRPPTESIVSHRSGMIGKCIVRAKRKILSFIWNLFREYFENEREFQSHLVRYLNDVSKYVDARDASNFWELIRKLDYDITKSGDRISRIHDEQIGALHSFEKRAQELVHEHLGSLRTQGAAHEAELRILDSVVRGIEGILSRLGRQAESGGNTEANAVELTSDPSYLLLENRFRGSETEIRSRLQIYPDIFVQRSAPSLSAHPILEIGCGRGELLTLFQERGLSAYGVDLDPAMIEASREKKVDARYENGITHLETLSDNSLAGVIAIQVVEHLTRDQLQQLFSLCHKKVVRGGLVVFETINPRSVLALSSNYFRDPTHIWPLHPDTLSYAMELAGLHKEEVRMLSPVSEEALLQPIPYEEFFTPRWRSCVDAMNRNINQLNELLYGYQDYCVIASVSK